MTPSEDMIQLTPPGKGSSYFRLSFATPEWRESSATNNGVAYVLMNEEEIDDLIERLEAVQDQNSYVGVQVSGKSGGVYAYIDPSGSLEVGDRVLVPFGYGNTEHVAKVVAVGYGPNRSGYNGRCKNVAALLAVTELSA